MVADGEEIAQRRHLFSFGVFRDADVVRAVENVDEAESTVLS